MTQPTGTTPLTPGEQLLNPDIEHIEIPQQQQQPETWTVWVETYVNARIQHEVVPLREEILLLPRSCPGTRNTTRCCIRSPSVRLQGKPASGVRWIRESGEAFANACRLYLQLQSGTTTSAETKIGWILSFMTSGRARTWRDSAIAHHAATGSLSGSPSRRSWMLSATNSTRSQKQRLQWSNWRTRNTSRGPENPWTHTSTASGHL